jgi:site-specific DNA recombinase
MIKKLATYCRVSTKDQADKNTQENQERSIKEFLKDKEVQVIKEYSDPGMSGASRDRPQYNKMLEELDQYDGICVYDVDRLSRDFEMGVNLMFMLKQMSKTLYVSRTGNIMDFSSDEDQLIHVIKSWVSDQERKKIKARQLEGMNRYREAGKKWGRPAKEINWKKYDELKKFGLSDASISRMMEIHPVTFCKAKKKRTS